MRLTLSQLAGALLLLTALATPARADVALLMGEPYGRFGSFNPTGHVAVYLSRVCAETPTLVRRCLPGEVGVVISRYHRVGGLDWVVIPLIPYLYAVDSAADVPLAAERPDLPVTSFVIPQIPSSRAPSRPVHGVLESVVRSKKYVVPLAIIQPWIPIGMAAGYLITGRFNHERHAVPVTDPEALEAWAREAAASQFWGRPAPAASGGADTSTRSIRLPSISIISNW